MFPKGDVSAAMPPENAAKRRTASRFAKPRSFIARAACCPDRGKLSMQWKVPERERFYSFRFYEKNGE